MAVPNQYNRYTSLYTVPKKPELTEVQKRLIERMQRSRCKVWESYAAYSAAEDSEKKPDNYFPTKTGWGIARKRVLNGNIVEFVTTAPDCPLVEEVQPKVVLDIHNKIPGALLQEILANFNKVCEDSNNECAAQIYRERDGERKYFIYYPEQKVSTAQVTYTHDPQLMELAKAYDLIMELHSHDSMGAFWSGTDDNNENTCGFYMVIGRFNSTVVEYKCRAKLDKLYTDFACSEIFDFGDTPEEQILTRANFIAPNEELDKKITKESLTYYTGAYQTGYDLWDYGAYSYQGYNDYNYGKSTKKSRRYLAQTELAARKRLIAKLKDAPNAILPEDALYNELWDHAEYIKTRRRWESCGYYDDQAPMKECWKRIPKNQAGAEEEVSQDAAVASDYVTRMSKCYSADGFKDTSVAGGIATGIETADYLAGNGDEAAARYGTLPGKIQQYSNFDLDLGTADVNDQDYNDNLNMAVASRTESQSNIETFLQEGMGGVREETENKFIANVMNIAFLHTPSASINVGVFWELLTPVEKTRLAKAFHCSVLDLAAILVGSSAVVASPDVAEFLYKCILGDAKYVECKLGLITTKVMAEKPNTAARFVALIHEMLEVERDVKEAKE